MESGKDLLHEWRRKQALKLSTQGWRQHDIAVALNVQPSTVSRWLTAAGHGGPQALEAHARPGRPARLRDDQKRLIPDFLGHGAEAYGFRGELWTCRRVARVIQEEFGVAYSRSQVSRLLKALHWTPQMPLTRAIQREEEAIRRWREEKWPLLRQQARRERRTPVFIDEAGFYLLPGVVRTYAPEGRTPILKGWQSRDHLSVMGAVTMPGKVFSLVRQESLSGLETVAFLAHLRRVAARRLLVIWDGSPIHRRAEVKEFLAGTNGAVRVEPLPAYAPDLNPVEWMWQHLKHAQLRNVICLDLEQLHLEFHLALGRVRAKPGLIKSFFEGAQIEL
jgi:transposase